MTTRIKASIEQHLRAAFLGSKTEELIKGATIKENGDLDEEGTELGRIKNSCLKKFRVDDKTDTLFEEEQGIDIVTITISFVLSPELQKTLLGKARMDIITTMAEKMYRKLNRRLKEGEPERVSMNECMDRVEVGLALSEKKVFDGSAVAALTDRLLGGGNKSRKKRGGGQ